jgi:hypothetical protein
MSATNTPATIAAAVATSSLGSLGPSKVHPERDETSPDEASPGEPGVDFDVLGEEERIRAGKGGVEG